MSIDELMKKVQADVAELEAAIVADESPDQSSIRKEMEKLHKQFTALIAKAKVYADKAQKIMEKADAELENAQNFSDSAVELLTTLRAASEAMDPAQWDWGDEEEETEA